ncbi:MAG: mechanosensitive ion channel domain-containing protein, partial [Rhodoglobus sp.]
IIAILTIGAILLTFPGAQALGASVLASAGLVSVVAGIAAQSALANVFAGMQLAFSDAIRVDDVVVVADEWGRIEEITLTYVVVTTWDQRRLVLPSTYFTTTPFENWTKSGSALFGGVELDLDWRVNTAGLRAELAKILDATELWDRRASNVQVTDATGGLVRVRVMVSAANAGALWDLRCLVREKVVAWSQTKAASALPRTRVLMLDDDRATKTRATATTGDGMFSGSPEATERGQQFKDTPAGERP